MITIVGAIIAASGVFLVVMGIGQARRRSATDQFGGRLAEFGSAGAAMAPPAPPASLRERLNRLFEPLAKRTGKGNAKRGRLPLAEQLAKADLKLRTSEFLMIQVGAVCLLALVGLLRFGVGIQMIVLGIAGYFVPGFWVRRRMAARLKAFNDQLGDTLVLLSNALKAGYSFAQAIDTVAKNATPPISIEFARAVREMNLGGSVDEALQNMTRRIESADFDLLVTAVAIHRSVGGNLAEILDNIAHTIRERVRIKGEIKTLTAQASASGTLITFLPIVLGLFMYLVTPTYFKPMTQSFIGWAMLGFAAFLIFIGNLIIRRVVAIEV
ncbi:MAG TPA: type II secretion system F family protein [Candidatus Nitrosotalea sp.]|nr:type II secretion system F family protein [Candidatus Nitrosotalea sp.]